MEEYDELKKELNGTINLNMDFMEDYQAGSFSSNG